MAAKHTILGGKVHVYQRDGSPLWQCSTYLDGKNRRVSTKEQSLSKAKDFAEDWFFQLRHMKAEGTLSTSQTFTQAGHCCITERLDILPLSPVCLRDTGDVSLAEG